MADLSAFVNDEMAKKGIIKQTAAPGVPPEAAAAAMAQASTVVTEDAAGKAAAAVAEAKEAATPGTEGDDDPGPATFTLKRKVGDKEVPVTMTDSQIFGTLDRYTALNARHATYKPIMALAEKLMSQMDPNDPKAAEKVADIIASSLKAQAKDPVMGGDGKQAAPAGGAAGGQDDDDAFDPDAWAAQNGVDLPAPLKKGGRMDKQSKDIAALTQAMGAMTDTVNRIAGVLPDALNIKNAKQQVGSAADQVQKARIGQNLDGMQQKLRLGDEDFKPFFQFAMERGYTMADFLDSDLAMTVGTDYANMKASPQAARIMAQLQRRMASTGSLGSAPSGGGAAAAAAAAPAETPDSKFINGMVDQKLAAKR